MSQPKKLALSAVVLIAQAVAVQALVAQQDPVDYMNAVVLREQTTSGRYVGDVPIRRQSAIIDDKSRLVVHFDREELTRLIGVTDAQQRMDSLLRSSEYRGVTARLDSLRNASRHEPANEDRDSAIQMIERELRSSRKVVLTRRAGFEFRVNARVLPKAGPAYDIPVQGFSTVRDSSTSDSARERQTRTTTIQTHAFAPMAVATGDGVQVVIDDDLPDGIIELEPWTLKEGDVVVVTVNNVFHLERKLSWTLHVRDIGVHTDQPPTLLLVKRLGGLPSDSNELASRFEPAPGASFLFTLTTRSPGWNFINPAIGLNGTFVDFRKDKSIEIGVGPVVSLFGGILQASWGVDLSTRAKNHYWSIGLGFLDLASKLGGGNANQGSTATGAAGQQANVTGSGGTSP